MQPETWGTIKRIYGRHMTTSYIYIYISLNLWMTWQHNGSKQGKCECMTNLSQCLCPRFWSLADRHWQLQSVYCRCQWDDLESMAMQQEPIDWRYLPCICLAYFWGLCKGISQQTMAKHMVQTYLHLLDPEIPIDGMITNGVGFTLWQTKLM